MTEKKKPAPKHTTRTATPGYFFAAMKAGEAMQRKAGTTRKSAKLPTSLDDLKMMKVKLR